MVKFRKDFSLVLYGKSKNLKAVILNLGLGVWWAGGAIKLLLGVQ